MPLTEQQRKQVIYAFCIIFYALAALKLWQGLFLFQVQPIVFNNRFDLFTWMIMKTGIHRSLLHDSGLRIVFDLAYYSMPLCYVLAYKRSIRTASLMAVVMAIVNYLYIQCYTLYATSSIEGFIAWLLFPFLLMSVRLKSFYLVLHGLRYFLLFFFVSAAAWKFVQGGIFNFNQMSGIFLFQHKEYLTSSPDASYTAFIYWFIRHPYVSYFLYLAATLLELSFITGFFTRKKDHLLLIAGIVFLVTDLIFMRISYLEILPLLLPLLFSKYQEPQPKTITNEEKTEAFL
jgi:hypothetical protein